MGRGGGQLRDEGFLWHYLRTLWESLSLLILGLLLRIVDASQLPVRQFLCFFSVHALCEPSARCIKPLLLPRFGRGDQELTVVLDLDETLVCAYDSAGLPAGLHGKAVQAGLKWFQLQCVAANKDKEGKVKINHVIVYERPGLREFLARASELAELVLFTAGLEGYASPLVDRIDPENRISARLYRPSTVITRYREHVKDLSRLGRDLRRTVIIDNNPCSFVLQPSNGVPCVPFTAENANDSQLLDVLLPLLQLLSAEADVRPVLKERFQMAAWFHSRGISTDRHTLLA